MLSPRMSGATPRLRATSAAASSDCCGVAIMCVTAACEPRIAGLGRLVSRRRADARAPASGSVMPYLSRIASASANVVGSGTVGPDAIDCGIVAGHIRNGERHDFRRITSRRQPAALDGRQMLAHAIHLADVGAALEQRAIDRLLVLQREAGRRQGSSAEPPPEIRHSTRSSSAQALHHVQDALGRLAPGEVRAPGAPPRRLRCARMGMRGRSA